MKFLFQTESSWSCLVLRVALGVVMLPHGAQKVFGWFGGYGFEASLGMFTEKMHIPVLLAILVILAESAGSLGLITGLFTRVAAFGILCDMIGAVALVHWRNGFFMNWSGKQAGEGFEYHLLMIGMALALVLAGGGKFSLDRVVAVRQK
jgi:putative oxidoreductase